MLRPGSFEEFQTYGGSPIRVGSHRLQYTLRIVLTSCRKTCIASLSRARMSATISRSLASVLARNGYYAICTPAPIFFRNPSGCPYFQSFCDFSDSLTKLSSHGCRHLFTRSFFSSSSSSLSNEASSKFRVLLRSSIKWYVLVISELKLFQAS